MYTNLNICNLMWILPEGEVRASWGFPVFFESSLWTEGERADIEVSWKKGDNEEQEQVKEQEIF